VIEAAGGVVWRGDRDAPEVLLVHRPRYDDWSFPKGKLDPGEDHATAARREVQEETGLRCDLGPELPSVRYRDHHGREKRVRYWVMVVVDGTFTPNDEVDELEWLPVDAARLRLTHAHDADVLDAFRPAAAAP
jgi:8-oxo-dGTP pyrophosphatase MutT (NUDIX family)